MKCNKVKNPCKICFQPVTYKNGLQCQGACHKWAHFKCLNYTPGKIQDIKAGAIKITCPCPDCNTGGPKEVLTNPPYTCTNTKCPANKLPVCTSIECPSNEGISSYPNQGCSPPKPPCPPPRSPCPPSRSPCPPPKSPCPPPRSPCPPPRSPCPPPKSPCPPPRSPCKPPKPPCPPPKLPSCTPPKTSPCPTPLKSNSNSKLPPCSRTPPLLPRRSSSSCSPVCPPVCPPSCPSCQRAKNTKKSFSPKQSRSCSIMSESCSSGKQFDKMRTISSDSKLAPGGVDPKMLFAAIEGLCNTVGELSHQLRNLMCEMQTGYES